MPILGTLASQFSGKSFSSFESIETATVGSGGSASVTFNSIPATYTHLQVRCISRSTYSGSGDGIQVHFNSDNSVSGTNYAYHLLIGTGSSVVSATNSSYSFIVAGDTTGGTSTSGMFGTNIFDILDYANTNKYKTLRTLNGNDQNGSGSVRFISGLWQSNSAITRIDFNLLNGGNYAQYSHFALYGIKGA
jgi:hypothetical protein